VRGWRRQLALTSLRRQNAADQELPRPDLPQCPRIRRHHLVWHDGHTRSKDDARSMRALAKAGLSSRAAPKHPAVGRCPVVAQSSPDPGSQRRRESGVEESRHWGSRRAVLDRGFQAGEGMNRARRPPSRAGCFMRSIATRSTPNDNARCRNPRLPSRLRPRISG
jgi:hypothetical protein